MTHRRRSHRRRSGPTVIVVRAATVRDAARARLRDLRFERISKLMRGELPSLEEANRRLDERQKRWDSEDFRAAQKLTSADSPSEIRASIAQLQTQLLRHQSEQAARARRKRGAD